MSERVRNVNSTDTLRTGAAEAGADPDDENRIDFGTLFPAKGDSRRPPEWFGRALLYVALAVIVFMFCWRSWGDISYLVLDIIISLFLALAVEPLVVALVAHGWKRGVASAVSLVGVAVVVGVLLTLFGNMFVQQMIAMVRGLSRFVSSWTSMPRSRCRKSAISAWKSSTISRPRGSPILPVPP